MRFKAKKVYGRSKIVGCAFCGKVATAKNEQDVEVCPSHKHSKLEEIKCTCGSWLEQRSGKFGAYFNCLNCGNMNFQKAMQIKEITMKDIPKPSSSQYTPNLKRREPQQRGKEITITTDDVEYFS